MTIDANAYSVSLFRTEIDGENVFEARVSELPGIVGYGDTAAEAHAMVIEAIQKLAEMADADGESLPAPTPRDSQYSGRITLRMSQALHRLARATADREGVPMNALLCERLAISLGMTAAAVSAPSIPHHGNVIESIKPDSLQAAVHFQFGILGSGGHATHFTIETAASTPSLPEGSKHFLSLLAPNPES
jgi:predicted RNase H-like HicB family nuclease